MKTTAAKNLKAGMVIDSHGHPAYVRKVEHNQGQVIATIADYFGKVNTAYFAETREIEITEWTQR